MIAQVISEITSELPSNTRLVAVSKYHPAEAIKEAYDAGQRVFGESHVQELQKKYDILPADIEWHFIGHLQTNKVKYIAPYVSLIHAVDTEKLLREISKQGEKCSRRIACLLQLHVAQEETKFGFSLTECDDFLASGVWRELPGVEIRGIMCMASNVDNEAQISEEFRKAHEFFLHAQENYFQTEPGFCECSMGMSDDYRLAIAQGSTLVRIGSKIFGARVY